MNSESSPHFGTSRTFENASRSTANKIRTVVCNVRLCSAHHDQIEIPSPPAAWRLYLLAGDPAAVFYRKLVTYAIVIGK